MELLGICAICGRPARYTCPMCARFVCEFCYNFRIGVCTHCTKKVI